jgi:hypothetical protein
MSITASAAMASVRKESAVRSSITARSTIATMMKERCVATSAPEMKLGLWPLVFGAIFIHFMQIEWAQNADSAIPDFLPVIGDRLVDCLQGKGGRLAEKWRWKDIENDGLGRVSAEGQYNGLITWDGSRGGYPGMILEEELRKLDSGKASKL